MICSSGFKGKESAVVRAVNRCLYTHFDSIDLNGSVHWYGNFIEWQVYIGSDENAEGAAPFVMRVGIRDKEDGNGDNFMYVPSIVIPQEYCGNLLGTELLLCLAKEACRFRMAFFVTGIANMRFKDYLLRLGGIVDADGDVELVFDIMLNHISFLIATGQL